MCIPNQYWRSKRGSFFNHLSTCSGGRTSFLVCGSSSSSIGWECNLPAGTTDWVPSARQLCWLGCFGTHDSALLELPELEVDAPLEWAVLGQAQTDVGRVEAVAHHPHAAVGDPERWRERRGLPAVLPDGVGNRKKLMQRPSQKVSVCELPLGILFFFFFGNTF